MIENNDNQENGAINVELNEEIAQGVYSNLAVITHSQSEFVVDFIRLMPGVPKARVQSRIILTPENTKRLLFAIQENIMRFEMANGPIKISEEGQKQPFPMNFGTHGEA